jgi:hypothetical protein
MKSLIRTAPAAALAATVVALAFPAIASALPDTPGEWDLGAYEGCLASGEGQLPDKPNAAEDHDHHCCINSGGVWDASAKKCVAPPAEPAEAPGTRAPSRVPVQVFDPVRPTTTRVPGGVFVQTLTVAP